MRPKNKLRGRKFGKLKVLRENGRDKHGHCNWLCKCICGKLVTISSSQLMAGHNKSCGCYTSIYKRNNKRQPKGTAALNALYSIYKYSAKRKGFKFSLTKEEFKILTESNCHYCGISPSLKWPTNKYKHKYNGQVSYNGIDRIDSNEGYSTLNVISCCRKCNLSKNSITYEIAKKFIQIYETRYGK